MFFPYNFPLKCQINASSCFIFIALMKFQVLLSSLEIVLPLLKLGGKYINCVRQ